MHTVYVANEFINTMSVITSVSDADLFLAAPA